MTLLLVGARFVDGVYVPTAEGLGRLTHDSDELEETNHDNERR
jgi:hypothetical protein